MIFHECGAPILAELQASADNTLLLKLYDAGKYGGKPVVGFCPHCHKPINDSFRDISAHIKINKLEPSY